jgi:hypothetical protein
MKAMIAQSETRAQKLTPIEPQCGQRTALFRTILPQFGHFFESKKPLKPQYGQGTSMLAVFWPQSGHLP